MVVATAAAGVITVIVLVKTLGIPLLTRLSKQDALEHPRRRLIYNVVREQPGLNFRDLLRRTNLPAGGARHHLNILERSDVIVEKNIGQTVRFYENHGAYDNSWREVAVLRGDGMKELYEWLSEHPGLAQKDVLTGLEAKGWSRSTTQHRLDRLVKGGAVKVTDRGRLRLYSVAPIQVKAPPPAIPPAPVPLPPMGPARPPGFFGGARVAKPLASEPPSGQA